MDSVSFGSKCEFNRDLYKAAIKGDIQPFTDDNQHLDLILTPIKNTILHVHLSSETRKSISFVREMLEKCPSLLLQVNANGDTPLHVAARHGYSTIVEVLIECAKTQPQDTESGLEYKQLMIRKSNNEGNSALHEAVSSDYVRVVEILTKEDFEFSHFANNFGETPLFIAAERGCLLSLREILEDASITRELLKNKQCLTKNRNEHGWTPLHFAAYYRSFRITKLLLEYDKSAAYAADKNRKMTPLHMAVSNASPLHICFMPKQFYVHMQIIEEIISQCPDCCQMVDDRGWNVLHFAMTKLPVRHLVTKKDAKGNTPLHVLAACRPREYPDIKKTHSKETDILQPIF
ncbi:protein ACCELERATED CELL DEATH 6-like [Pistacia vera]|uniref:protein ACCELERATED CELL DEATH 6-like n=1 Tax=Pistacia vera TaxID=55513 RepID=UPI0012639321|nr:protein ACCELERATED CELL DEATH 6-like [Pistacia vera]